MNGKISPRWLAVIVLAAVGVVALIGWFAFVSPQRSKANGLDSQIADAQTQLSAAKALANVARSGSGKKSGMALLRTAMPENVQMPAVLNEVHRLAASSNVSLDTFTPAAGTALDGYDAVPIQVNVGGRYAAVESFLRRLRREAGASKSGRVHATGRLYDVQTVNLSPGGTTGNELNASIQLAVFVYTGQALAPTTTTTTTSDETTGG